MVTPPVGVQTQAANWVMETLLGTYSHSIPGTLIGMQWQFLPVALTLVCKSTNQVTQISMNESNVGEVEVPANSATISISAVQMQHHLKRFTKVSPL
jgi:hypothetical protein